MSNTSQDTQPATPPQTRKPKSDFHFYWKHKVDDRIEGEGGIISPEKYGEIRGELTHRRLTITQGLLELLDNFMGKELHLLGLDKSNLDTFLIFSGVDITNPYMNFDRTLTLTDRNGVALGNLTYQLPRETTKTKEVPSSWRSRSKTISVPHLELGGVCLTIFPPHYEYKGKEGWIELTQLLTKPDFKEGFSAGYTPSS